MSIADDRDAFMFADFPLTLPDGVVINVLDDPDGYLSAGENEPADTEYVGVTVDDPDTGAHDSIWSIGVSPHQSGHEVRALLWDLAVDPDGYYALLGSVREQRDHELAERADAAARDIITL